jgi:sulfatase maturation enzyme AslB (radical SAM superfamily)
MSIKHTLKTQAITIGAKTVLKLMSSISEEKWMKLVNPILSRQPVPEGALVIELMLRRFHRVFPTLSNGVKEKFIKNFIVKPFTVYSPRRQAFLADRGYDAPSLLVISPTMKCNLACYGCYAGDYKKGEDLDFEIVNRVINEAKDMGIFFFVISGGEPNAWPHLVEMLETHSDAMFQIYTNGTLIDDKRADEFARLGNAIPF